MADSDSEEVPGLHVILSDSNGYIVDTPGSEGIPEKSSQPLSPLIGCMMGQTCP